MDSSRTVQGVTSNEKRYYITSHEDKTAEFIAHVIHSYWHVENKLHWQLDVSFNEDQNRHRNGHAAENIAMMNITSNRVARIADIFRTPIIIIAIWST